jgi:hypothetical protein
LSGLGNTQIKGYTYSTPASQQEGGDTDEFLYASPGFTDFVTVESKTLSKGTPVRIKAVLTLEVSGTKNVCKSFHFADVSATSNDTWTFSGVTQTFMQQITGGCNPSVFVLKSFLTGGTGHPSQTTGPKLSLTVVSPQPVGATAPILVSTFYQTGSSTTAGGTRAQTSVGMLITYHLQALTKGVTLKFASGHTYN